MTDPFTEAAKNLIALIIAGEVLIVSLFTSWGILRCWRWLMERR